MGFKAKIEKRLKGLVISEVWLGHRFTYDWDDTAESDRNLNVPITVVFENGVKLLVYGQIHWISEKAGQI